MENASKALYIAASVLIGLLLITVFTRVFKAGASVNENYDQTQRTAQLEAYNGTFENFNVPENTIMDVITVANHAYSVNAATEYEPTSAVKIVIKVGPGKEFIIPDVDPNTYSSFEEYKSLRGQGKLLVKNKIMDGNNVRSIYDLVDKKMSPDGTEKLTKTYYGPVTYTKRYTVYVRDSVTGAITGEHEETKVVTEQATVYKYLFKCDKIEYHDASGKVKFMQFSINNNIEPTSINKWKPEYEN